MKDEWYENEQGQGLDKGRTYGPDDILDCRRANLLTLLPVDVRLKQRGKGWYMLNCLFHEDPNASLSLKKYDDGTWRYHCFGCGAKGDPIQYLIATKGMSFMDAVSELKREAPKAPERPVPVAEYPYRDEKGSILYSVVRYEPKNFRQKRPDYDTGGCIWNLQGVRRVLYMLPELWNLRTLKTGQDLFYVEGEKDVHTLWDKDLIATTHAGGASSWRDEFLEQIPSEYNLVLVPDMDDPGKQLMRRIWNAAQNKGRKCSFVLLNKGKDVTNFFEQGGTVDELKGLIT